MEEKKEIKTEEVEEKKGKIGSKQKEIIITVIVLLISVAVGFFIGKYLFELMH